MEEGCGEVCSPILRFEKQFVVGEIDLLFSEFR